MSKIQTIKMVDLDWLCPTCGPRAKVWCADSAMRCTRCERPCTLVKKEESRDAAPPAGLSKTMDRRVVGLH